MAKKKKNVEIIRANLDWYKTWVVVFIGAMLTCAFGVVGAVDKSLKLTIGFVIALCMIVVGLMIAVILYGIKHKELIEELNKKN